MEAQCHPTVSPILSARPRKKGCNTSNFRPSPKTDGIHEAKSEQPTLQDFEQHGACLASDGTVHKPLFRLTGMAGYGLDIELYQAVSAAQNQIRKVRRTIARSRSGQRDAFDVVDEAFANVAEAIGRP